MDVAARMCRCSSGLPGKRVLEDVCVVFMPPKCPGQGRPQVQWMSRCGGYGQTIRSGGKIVVERFPGSTSSIASGLMTCFLQGLIFAVSLLKWYSSDRNMDMVFRGSGQGCVVILLLPLPLLFGSLQENAVGPRAEGSLNSLGWG
jgi:hypothetical protein